MLDGKVEGGDEEQQDDARQAVARQRAVDVLSGRQARRADMLVRREHGVENEGDEAEDLCGVRLASPQRGMRLS